MSKSQFKNHYELDDKKKIGEELKTLRGNLKYTQDDVTEKVGLTRKQIIEIEKGTTNYGVDTLLKYLDGIECFAVFKMRTQRKKEET